MHMSLAEAAMALTDGGFFHNWMSPQQRETLGATLLGEEGDAILELLNKARTTIMRMPVTYDQDGKGLDAVVHLHYFGFNADAWITERDVGSEPTEPQHQAYGHALIGLNREDVEHGYISIEEWIENNCELDLHWKVKTMREVLHP